MQLNIILKDLIVIDKQKLEVEPVFAVSWKFFELCGPKNHDAIMMELDQCSCSNLT